MARPERFEVHNRFISKQDREALFRRASVVVLPFWGRVIDRYGPARVMAFAGGALMAVGAALARGCTSGQALTGGALLNLVSNAMKYSATGRTIEVTTGHDDAVATVSVRDHGIGIAASDATRCW